MNIEQAWLWLTNIDKIGNKKIKTMLSYFDSPIDIYRAEEKDLRMIMGLSNSDIFAVLKAKETFNIKNFEEYLVENEIKYISIQNEIYPKLLKNIFDPPHVIYYKGTLPSKAETFVGVVGSRNCSEYGMRAAYDLSKSLAQNGVTIVSGMAIGIDTYAHKGALDGSGKTIAVLGCGVDICYPKSNRDLMREIIKNGAVISEYHPKTAPLPQLFPARNRIISGLCRGTIIVEAALKSGSLITADQALDQGREVFSVPGSIFSSLSEGTNNLIRQGANIVPSYKDVLDGLGLSQINDKIEIKLPITAQTESIENNFEKNLDGDEKIVYSCIELKGSHVDDIVFKSKLEISKLQHVLTMLEINGVVKQLPGKIFERLM